MYDSAGGTDVRLIDGPGTGATAPAYIAPATGFLPALDGVDGNGLTPPTGGSGIRGWLSGLYKYISQFTFVTGALNVNIASGGGSGAATATAVAAAATAGAVKSAAGVFFGVTVATPGSAQMQLTDGQGGKVIATIPANQPPGDVPIYGGGRPFTTGLYANSGPNTPAVTVFYS